MGRFEILNSLVVSEATGAAGVSPSLLANFSLLVALGTLVWTIYAWHASKPLRKAANNLTDLMLAELTAKRKEKFRAQVTVECQARGPKVTVLEIRNEGPGLALNISLRIEGHPLSDEFPLKHLAVGQTHSLRVEGSGITRHHESELKWEDVNLRKYSTKWDVAVNEIEATR